MPWSLPGVFHAESAQPLFAHRTAGILPVKVNYQQPEGGSDPDGLRVPPAAGETERYAINCAK